MGVMEIWPLWNAMVRMAISTRHINWKAKINRNNRQKEVSDLLEMFAVVFNAFMEETW